MTRTTLTLRKANLLSAAALTVFALSSACQQKGGPVSVARVDPAQGIVSGGDQVVIHGNGFEPGKTQVEVRFGRVRAEQVSISSGDKITVVTPPGNRGPVDVSLMFDDGAQFKIPEGFRYIPATETGDVRKAFFSDKPGTNKPSTTPTNTVPAPAK
jgi:hypothetical protein